MKEEIMKHKLKLAMIAGGILAAAAFSGAIAEEPVSGGELRYGTGTEVPGLDPHVYSGTSGKVINLAIYNSLLEFDQSGNIVPSLAESFETSDAKSFTFRLREGVKFHGGEPLTANDVKYSLGRILDPATGATLKANLEGIEITVIDDHTVRLDKQEPDATLLTVLAMPEASIVSEQWMSTAPNVRIEANGTGPFILAEHEPNVRAVVTKNPDYWEQELPRLDRVVFQMIPNSDARVNAMRTGAVDMIEFVPWKDIDALKRQPDIEVETAGGSFMNIWYNVSRSPFDDVRVRRAISHAIDREAVSTAAYFGHGAPLYGPPTLPDSPYYNEDLAQFFSRDLDKARSLLAEAGFPDGFSMELVCFNGLDIYTTTCQILQANLKEVGIDVRLRPVEFARMIENKNNGQYEAMVYGVSVKMPDPDAYAYYFGADSTYWAKQLNFSHPELEELLVAGRSVVDVGQRKQIYHELEKIVLDISPWTFINWRDQGQAYKTNIRGYVHMGGALNEAGPGMAMKLMWLAE
jgi:peptide/nickel transport system substrate-binding protein